MRDEAETVAVPVIIMMLLAVTIGLFDLDLLLFNRLNQVFRVLPDGFWANVTILGDALVAFVLLSLLVLRYPQVLATGVITGLIATGLSRSVKLLTAVERPAAVLGEQVHTIGSVTLHHLSFPSGHTTAAFAAAGVIALMVQCSRLNAFLFCLALLVGASRIAVGAHWPMDVATGAAFGWFSAWAGWKLARHWRGAATVGGQRWLSGVFLLLALLLFRLDTHYPQAVGLQWLIASGAMLVMSYHGWKLWRKAAS